MTIVHVVSGSYVGSEYLCTSISLISVKNFVFWVFRILQMELEAENLWIHGARLQWRTFIYSHFPRLVTRYLKLVQKIPYASIRSVTVYLFIPSQTSELNVSNNLTVFLCLGVGIFFKITCGISTLLIYINIYWCVKMWELDHWKQKQTLRCNLTRLYLIKYT